MQRFRPVMVLGCVLYEGCRHDGSGVCLGDGQTETYLKDMGMTGLALPGRWPGGGLSEGYGHDGLGVCLGDGQTWAEEVPSQGGRGDALLRRMPPYLT